MLQNALHSFTYRTICVGGDEHKYFEDGLTSNKQKRN